MTTKTKQDLLAKMAELKACRAATEYVRDQPDDMTAEQIWRGCSRMDWLVWFAVRMTDIRTFTLGCADRAVRTYAAHALERVGQKEHADTLRALSPIVDRPTATTAKTAAADAAAYAAAAYAADAYAANAAAAYAAYAAAAYADAYAAAYAAAAYAADAAYAANAADAEHETQLDQLHKTWPAIQEKL